MTKRLVRIGATGGIVLLMSAPLFAQQSQAPNRRIEGDWVRTDPAGAGSFSGLADQFKSAQLTPEAQTGRRGGAPARGAGPGPAAATPGRPNAAGVPYIVVDRPCANAAGRGNGALLLNPDSGGIHIIEHKDEVVLAGERGGVRHIYMDNRPHPALSGWTPTAAGHSTGHYEGNVLVIDTTGIVAGAVVAGGQRTPETRLTERLEVSPDGKQLTISYTWQDPKIFVRPHTYAYIFDRLPAGSYAFEDWCDASDPIERQSVVPPPQG